MWFIFLIQEVLEHSCHISENEFFCVVIFVISRTSPRFLFQTSNSFSFTKIQRMILNIKFKPFQHQLLYSPSVFIITCDYWVTSGGNEFGLGFIKQFGFCRKTHYSLNGSVDCLVLSRCVLGIYQTDLKEMPVLWLRFALDKVLALVSVPTGS